MRYVKISKQELQRTYALYESVMSQASHGLLFREGVIVGDELAKVALAEGGNYFPTAEKLLVGRGWADEARLEKDRAVFKGSMEGSFFKGCHRLRGIVKSLYEAKLGAKLDIEEVECEGKTGDNCIFRIATHVDRK